VPKSKRQRIPQTVLPKSIAPNSVQRFQLVVWMSSVKEWELSPKSVETKVVKACSSVGVLHPNPVASQRPALALSLLVTLVIASKSFFIPASFGPESLYHPRRQPMAKQMPNGIHSQFGVALEIGIHKILQAFVGAQHSPNIRAAS
jgi:hypothetical protein